MSGASERLIRSVKAALKATLKEWYNPDETLHLLLPEAEQVINSRPLTSVNANLDEEALTSLLGAPVECHRLAHSKIHN
ncbi:unnamed protein product [Parnassius apollo]|uniref:(apollo) hypothetical protein n=1 Tax=Parnassius apollo TaxID=110799 RepID=A0A8S3Y9K6_PARAO|nr:unnamed protein product [Parnassius apollo]